MVFFTWAYWVWCLAVSEKHLCQFDFMKVLVKVQTGEKLNSAALRSIPLGSAALDSVEALVLDDHVGELFDELGAGKRRVGERVNSSMSFWGH